MRHVVFLIVYDDSDDGLDHDHDHDDNVFLVII